MLQGGPRLSRPFSSAKAMPAAARGRSAPWATWGLAASLMMGSKAMDLDRTGSYFLIMKDLVESKCWEKENVNNRDFSFLQCFFFNLSKTH